MHSLDKAGSEGVNGSYLDTDLKNVAKPLQLGVTYRTR